MTYLDIKGRKLNRHDQILYAVAGGKLQIGRVLKLYLNNSGIEIVGKGNKRTAKITTPEAQVWQLKKEYYINHKTNKA
jgi:hypothetical protein